MVKVDIEANHSFQGESTGRNTPSVPGEFEYQLVIQTGKEVSKQIADLRILFEEEYHIASPSPIEPYIKIARFKAREEMEPTIERWIQRICASEPAFNVMLNNFSGFPTGKLFVRIQYPEPISRLTTRLSVIDDYIKSYGCPSANIVTHPHVTIASKIPGDLYSKAMLDYSRKDYSGNFLVEDILLLKRKHSKEAFKKINLFKLMPALMHASEAV